MTRCTRICAFALLALAGVLVASAAGAQTTATTTSGPVVAENPLQAFPNRSVNGVSLGQSTRPVGLNPDGINFSDCISDMTLQYSVELTGFTGESLEVWASTGADCSIDTNRGNGGVPECWYVANEGAINQVAENAVNINVRVQDIVGLTQLPPEPAVLVNETSSACYTQPTSSAQTITLFFLPVSGVTFTGTDYSQQITADLVGPPAPTGVSIGDGDTLFVVNWTANDDADTQDYDVFIDPIPGEGDASASGASMTTVLVCPDASTSADATTAGATGTTVADDASEGGLEASLGDDASTSLAGDSSATGGSAACHYENVGPAGPLPGSTSCNSSILQSSNVIDSGVTSNVIEDEAGDIIDSGGISNGPVGISTIPCDNLLNVLPSACPPGQPAYTATAFTVNGESNATYKITQLTNGVTYNVVVAAVDASGNVGPPSTEACDYPAPVNDFWDLYRAAGGQAGGGFCALHGGTGLAASSGSPIGSTIAFGAGGAAVIAAGRRRRRRNK